MTGTTRFLSSGLAALGLTIAFAGAARPLAAQPAPVQQAQTHITCNRTLRNEFEEGPSELPAALKPGIEAQIQSALNAFPDLSREWAEDAGLADRSGCVTAGDKMVFWAVVRCFHRRDGVQLQLTQAKAQLEAMQKKLMSGAAMDQKTMDQMQTVARKEQALEARKSTEESAGNYDVPLCYSLKGNENTLDHDAAGSELSYTGAPYLKSGDAEEFPTVVTVKRMGAYPGDPRTPLYTVSYAKPGAVKAYGSGADAVIELDPAAIKTQGASGNLMSLTVNAMASAAYLAPFFKSVHWEEIKSLLR